MSTLLALSACLSLGCSAILDWDLCSNDQQCPTTHPTCNVTAGVCVGQGGGAGLTVDQLLDNHCSGIYGVPLENALDADVMLIGSLLPKTGQLAQYGPPIDNAVAMAVNEINDLGGLFGKKMAVLSCDSGTSSDQATVAATHLVNAGVSAVIGPAASSVTIDTFNDVLRDAGVLTMTPSATAPALSDLADDGLLWRTCPSDAFQGAAMAGFLSGSGIGKIALVNRDDAYGNGLANAVRDGLCASFDCLDDTKFFNRKYDPDAFSTIQSQIALDLEGFAPEMTVLIAFGEDGVNFLNLMAQTTVSRRVIVSDGMKSSSLIAEVDDVEFICRMLGTQPAAPSGNNYQAFGLNYGASHGGAQPGAFSANAYDGTYLIGYAMAAAGANVTGATLSTALGRMSTGEPVNVGQTDWTANIQRLSSSETTTIDFQGASGPLDFTSKG